MAHNAHLTAVSIGYEASNVGLAIDGGAAVAAVFEIERERALERANAALAVFEAEARNAGIAYETQALTGIPYETTAEISAAARLCDLSIVLQPEQERDTFDNTIPLEILFQSGGPVLVMPHTHKGPFEPRRVGIAWDGSRLAARAVRDAAPFLARADAITIISVNESKTPEIPSPVELAAHLAMGARLRNYTFNHYRTRQRDEHEERGQDDVERAEEDVPAARGRPARELAIAANESVLDHGLMLER